MNLYKRFVSLIMALILVLSLALNTAASSEGGLDVPENGAESGNEVVEEAVGDELTEGNDEIDTETGGDEAVVPEGETGQTPVMMAGDIDDPGEPEDTTDTTSGDTEDTAESDDSPVAMAGDIAPPEEPDAEMPPEGNEEAAPPAENASDDLPFEQTLTADASRILTTAKGQSPEEISDAEALREALGILWERLSGRNPESEEERFPEEHPREKLLSAEITGIFPKDATAELSLIVFSEGSLYAETALLGFRRRSRPKKASSSTCLRRTRRIHSKKSRWT